jgi:glycerate-2-kinase
MSVRVIQNFSKLATSHLRHDALEIAEAGYHSIDLKTMFAEKLNIVGDLLTVHGHDFHLSDYKNIYVVGVGKGSGLAVQGIARVLNKRVTKGFAIDIRRRLVKKIKVYAGTHPLPSEQNIVATNKIIELIKSAGKDDLVITAICGGGSSLFCQPASMSCVDLQKVYDYLLKAGASIQEMNTVRKHLSHIHGGYFAKYAYPATVLALIISDVPGDDLNYVASGPTVLDKTTRAQAEKIAKRYKLSNLDLIETPKDKRFFERVTNIMIANGSQTVAAMSAKARELGYKPRVYSKQVAEPAKELGPKLAKMVKPGEALIGCGETQVHVTHPGRGGRNQDVALSAVSSLPKHTVVVSCASDGKDNEPVAGAIIDNPQAVTALAKNKINPDVAVEMNEGFMALKKIGGHLKTRKTTANISDFMIALRGTHHED